MAAPHDRGLRGLLGSRSVLPVTSDISHLSDSDGERSPLADPSRWAELIEGVQPEAFLVVISSSMGRSLRDRCSPEDIWQETLTQAWKARGEHQWQGKTAFRAWLFEIARNRIRDAARRMKTEKRGAGRPDDRIADPGNGQSSSHRSPEPPDSVTPSRVLMHAERVAAMERALSALPPELADVVRLHLLEELPMIEVARRLEIGVSMAWRRYRKAVELYTRLLSDGPGGARARS
jgi:RNA polymerase sigma-70 factor, ECF subfamily